MRLLKTIGCIAAVVNADSFDEEDYDFVRQLSAGGNTSNVTSPAPTTTTTTTTVASNPNVSQTVNATAPAVKVQITTSAAAVPPFTPPTAARRLRRLSAGLIKAYNFYCSAYTAASGSQVCAKMKTEGQIDATKYAAYTALFKTVKQCNVDLTSEMAGSSDCHVQADRGICINNNQPAGVTQHEGCTKGTAKGDGSGKYDYTTTNDFIIPNGWGASTAMTDSLKKASTDAASSMGSAAAQTALKTMLAGSAALIETQAASAGINVTAAFGISAADLTAISNAMSSGTLDLSAVAAGESGAANSVSSSLSAATTAVSNTVEVATMAAAVTQTGAGATAGAAAIATFGSIMMAFAALLL